MKLFKVEAKQCDYDEYDALMVWAETEEQAISVAVAYTNVGERYGYPSNFIEGATATEVVAPDVPCVELASFNAG